MKNVPIQLFLSQFQHTYTQYTTHTTKRERQRAKPVGPYKKRKRSKKAGGIGRVELRSKLGTRERRKEKKMEAG